MADPVDAVDSGRRPGKSAAAFRTISEVAGELEVPAHVLRFWESKFAQVKPLKRGGGRRYYRPEDVDLLRAIRVLLYTDGYTIKGVQKLLREGGVKSLAQAGQGPVAAPPAPDHAAVAAPSSEGQNAKSTNNNEIKSILSELESLKEALAQDI